MTSTDEPLGAHHYTDDEMHNEDVAHEHSDANVRTVLAFGTAMLAMIAVSAVLMYGLMRFLEHQAAARDPQLSPYASTSGGTPKGARLLTDEPANLRRFRQEEQGKLDSYGWMNQTQGIAHVSIDAAKKLVVEHGLPVRAGAADDRSEGTNAPAYGEASGGRNIPLKHAAPPAAPAPGSEQQEIKK
jgi:hypothetical protein